MIGRLSGILDGINEGWVLIDVGGVGYVVEVSARILSTLPPQGSAVTLSIETYVREDQLRLFGFLTEEDKSWFKLLMSVQGVGAKVALAIQGVLSATELAQAIGAQDKAMVARAPGVGPKVAQRIVQELKDKVPTSAFIQTTQAGGAGGAEGAGENAVMADALSALVNLGYARVQAHGAVIEAAKQADADAGQETGEVDTQTIIRLALKELGK